MLRTGVTRIALATAILAMFALSTLAMNSSAHLPAFDTGGGSYETAAIIDNIETSYAFYGEISAMTPGSSVGAKYYTFEGESGQEFAFEIGVESHHFLPCALLVGPGLHYPDNETWNIIESSGLEVPDGQGASGWSRVLHPSVDIFPKSHFEPFTQTEFYYVHRESVILPADGVYYLILTSVVYSEYIQDYQITSGTYFLATGYKEEFTVLDFVLMPWYWLRVQSFWGEHGGPLFILPAAIVVTLLLGMEALARRKDEAFPGRTRRMRLFYFAGLTGAYLMIGAAVSQVSLLALHAPEHGWEGIVILVLGLQLGGLVLGFVSAGFVKTHFFHMRGARLMVAAVITALALLIGAGLIAGPLLLLVSLATAMMAGRSAEETEDA
ncbi:MAG: hypothetical protein JSV90_06505 [Methanobacteriota archaeon]|nr:MAG: hypothetical protein JSV90_06505 [Euryarchaeota archaeon]